MGRASKGLGPKTENPCASDFRPAGVSHPEGDREGRLPEAQVRTSLQAEMIRANSFCNHYAAPRVLGTCFSLKPETAHTPSALRQA